MVSKIRQAHQEVELAPIKLYRGTGERRYLELAKFFLDERGYAHGMERKMYITGGLGTAQYGDEGFGNAWLLPYQSAYNGAKADATPAADGYVHLQRTWKAGDVVELDLPMPVRRVMAHENVEADRGKVALMRGPLVYCVEAADQPDVNLTRLTLAHDAEMTAKHRSDLLGGVTVLEGEALADGKNPIRMTAIPYDAWQNRSKGAMTVWIQQAANP